MEQKNKGLFYLGLSFFLWLIYSIIELILSRSMNWSLKYYFDFASRQPIEPPLTIELLLTFLSGFRYVLLFFVIFFFLFSVYKLSFTYPDKRNKIPLILSLVCLPLLLIVGIFINPPQGDMAGLGWIFYFVIFIPASALVFLGISFFISKVAFKIDSVRKKENKPSIFFWPIIISSILFILFSALTYFDKDYGFRNSFSKILIDALTGFSNSLPFVFVYIPIIIIMFFVWIYYLIKK